MHLNKNLTYNFLEVGKEKTIVIVIDNFLDSTQSLISLATKNMYGRPPEECTYPGVRAPIKHSGYLDLLKNTITAIMKKHNFIPPQINFKVDEATFSLLTTSEQDIDPNHTIPHFDGPEQDRLAVLHYLNIGDFGGTAFYRHVPTQFENITRDRVDKYVETAEQFVMKNPSFSKGYFTTSTNHFELMQVVEYVPNRVVLYPTSLLHSAFIENPEKNIDLNPAKGRLTTNTFISVKYS